jgi:hypothetical protein
VGCSPAKPVNGKICKRRSLNGHKMVPVRVDHSLKEAHIRKVTPWWLLCGLQQNRRQLLTQVGRVQLHASFGALRGHAGGGHDLASDAGKHHFGGSEGGGAVALCVHHRPHVDDVAEGVQGLPRASLDHSVLLARSRVAGDIPVPAGISSCSSDCWALETIQ